MEQKSIILSCIILAYFVVGGIAATFNVLDYGATGDGILDDTTSFLETWNEACQSDASSKAKIRVPEGKTFTMSPVIFKGPCKTLMHFEIRGSIVAPGSMWDHQENGNWITFTDLPKGLVINGGGEFDGNGQIWWNCRLSKTCPSAPNTLSLDNIKNLNVQSLTFVNSPEMHIGVFASSEVSISKLKITAPWNSPNTDGIHVESSENIQIFNSTIGTGDDCISIGTGVSGLNITEINCGPGHGISIGSLGRDGTVATVSHVHVSNCHIKKTQNGVRIKTWQGGRGLVDEVSFHNITFTSVSNPIIIDQFYNDPQHRNNASAGTSAVQIQNVKYSDLRGSCDGKFMITLNCSEAASCKDMEMRNVNIFRDKNAIKNAPPTFCKNAEFDKLVNVVPKLLC